MLTEAEQIVGLKRLADVLKRYECNFVIVKQDDVIVLKMAHTPNASEACFVTGNYDVWTGSDLKAADLNAEAAAEILIDEYFKAKTLRIREHSPQYSIDQIMKTLREGYQKK